MDRCARDPGASRRHDPQRPAHLFRPDPGAPRPAARPGDAGAVQRGDAHDFDRPARRAARHPYGQHQFLGPQPTVARRRMRTFGNLLAFSPELWLLGGAIVTFLQARFMPRSSTSTVALVSLVLAFLALATQFKQTITILDGAFLLDGFAIFIQVVLLGAAALCLLAGRADILPGESPARAEPGFFLLATLGAMLAASAAEMTSLFLALELLAINLYVLTGLARRGAGGISAGLGYLVLGLASSAVLLYGLALTFGLRGETRLAAAGQALP